MIYGIVLSKKAMVEYIPPSCTDQARTQFDHSERSEHVLERSHYGRSAHKRPFSATKFSSKSNHVEEMGK